MPFNPPKPKPGKEYKLSQLLEVSIELLLALR